MNVLGWHLGQWSIAAARYRRVYGTLPPPTALGATTLQSWWTNAHPTVLPGEITLIGVTPERESKWAREMVSALFQEVHPYVRQG